MRSMGAFTRTPPTRVSKLRSTSPSRISETSLEVPPMSKPRARSKPAAAATRAAPTTPPAGPESSACGARKRSAKVNPPEDCISRSREPGSASRSAATCARSSGVRYASTLVVSPRASSPISRAISWDATTWPKPSASASSRRRRSNSG